MSTLCEIFMNFYLLFIVRFVSAGLYGCRLSSSGAQRRLRQVRKAFLSYFPMTAIIGESEGTYHELC